ncbi:HAD family hydrolase [Arenibacterium sp. CAU 1754]
MTPKALVFDVDGTLAETEEAHRRAFNETFAEAGLEWTWSVEDYTRLLRTTGGKERMQAFRDQMGTGPDDDGIARLHRKKTALYGRILSGGGLTLRPGVADLIAHVRDLGLRVAVATTTNRPNVDALCMATWGIPAETLFDVIAAGDEVSHKKPAPDVFLLALERLGLRGPETLAFEDSANGLRSAKGANMPVVVTPSAYTRHEDFTEADWVVPSLALRDLPDRLKRLLSL